MGKATAALFTDQVNPPGAAGGLSATGATAQGLAAGLAPRSAGRAASGIDDEER